MNTGNVPFYTYPFFCFDLKKCFTVSYDLLVLETDIADADDLKDHEKVADVGDENEADYSVLKVALGEGHALQDILRNAIDHAKDLHAERLAKLRGAQAQLHKGHIDTAVDYMGHVDTAVEIER